MNLNAASSRPRAASGQSIVDQALFRTMIYLEQRRSERSGRPFALAVVDGTAISHVNIRKAILQKLVERLRNSIRETDTIGWYKSDSVLAIIFSEIGDGDKNLIDTLRHKVTTALGTMSGPHTSEGIETVVHVFPSDAATHIGLSEFTLYPVLCDNATTRTLSNVVKRTTDIAGSLVALLSLGPLMAVIALALKMSSPGPVLFRQERVGQCAKTFILFKFRTMYVDSDAAIHKDYVTKFISGGEPNNNKASVYKITDDPRITPLGRFLRKTSLDELPQLFNVLRDEMSLVGPRPPVPYEMSHYATWHRRRVFEAKPGMTGLWQVTGRSRTTFDEMVRLDLKYVYQRSVWLDLKIILRTPKAVLMGEGAY
jgi:lipopolysaccharide/colanic/teichoic acid biosynthesis glycosyltransferase